MNDLANGFAPPEHCQEREFLMTIQAAAECGLKRPGVALEMLEDVRDMIAARLHKKVNW